MIRKWCGGRTGWESCILYWKIRNIYCNIKSNSMQRRHCHFSSLTLYRKHSNYVLSTSIIFGFFLYTIWLMPMVETYCILTLVFVVGVVCKLPASPHDPGIYIYIYILILNIEFEVIGGNFCIFFKIKILCNAFPIFGYGLDQEMGWLRGTEL